MISVFLLLTLISSLTAASYSDCGSELGTVNSVIVSGCKDTDERCILRRNTNATVEINFTSKTDADTVKAVVHGDVADVLVPFHLPNDNGCSNSGMSCPLKSGQTYSYKTTLPVLSVYPRVKVTVKWELIDKDKKDIVCVFIPVKIDK